MDCVQRSDLIGAGIPKDFQEVLVVLVEVGKQSLDHLLAVRARQAHVLLLGEGQRRTWYRLETGRTRSCHLYSQLSEALLKPSAPDALKPRSR
jgi:hypothetical protein